MWPTIIAFLHLPPFLGMFRCLFFLFFEAVALLCITVYRMLKHVELSTLNGLKGALAACGVFLYFKKKSAGTQKYMSLVTVACG